MISKNGSTLICTPLIGKDEESLLSELNLIIDKRPDLVEWRADFFRKLGCTETVVNMAKTIKKVAKDIPIIFTVRSAFEGGQPIELTNAEIIELNSSICKNTDI
jgi:3-dehydroquinate dehydratase-1